MRTLDYNLIISEIQYWIKEYVNSANMEGVVIGISGGIDSAVTTKLCVNALGKENVIGLSLPCSSIQDDINDAKQFAQNLGIKFMKIELTNIYERFIEVTSPFFESPQIARANLKPRLRMMMLYYVGQSFGRFLIAGTSNRTELAIGYFTKYGDGGVDFEPIGELYKCEVREIANLLNIPENIIKKPPSAGLWLGQTDEDEIGLIYEILDEIIFRIDYNLSLDDLNQDDILKVKKMIRSAYHKNEMPPSFKIRH
ncbi:MAG: NAD+ synthase [Candidatus Thorarchaeota archaeon]